MNTLAQLHSGELKGIKHLKISQKLTSFPMEILTLCDTLEILDLSNNLLSYIPHELSKLKKLKIVFLSNNLFTSVPSVFKECKNLYMLGIKANQIEYFNEDILPLSISWLILTDNKITKLPDSIGDLKNLQKFMLAGNRLEALPSTMSKCKNLELLRLSANKLKEIPPWLLNLPRLSWLAFSGNPCVQNLKYKQNKISFKELEIGELLGAGASGEIFKAYSKKMDTHMAIKLFRSDITSDGFVDDEIDASMGVGEHENLIKVIAKLDESSTKGVLLEYISSEFINFASPPNFDTCTRDTYDETKKFSCQEIATVAKAISSALAHLHLSNLMHGDIYGHNILINSKNRCYLGDFGAATFYDGDIQKFEKIEVRAFGYLLDDMLTRCIDIDNDKFKTLNNLRQSCLCIDIEKRPSFKEMF